MQTQMLETIRSIVDSGRPLLLDGGLGSELQTRGYDISSPLWSAQLILNQPEVLREVHRAYLDAGAQCIITSSYQASIPGLAARGIGTAQIEAVFNTSVELACEAREVFLTDNPDGTFRPLVAASVGPYGAYLADGSEYRGNYGIDPAKLREFHRQRLQWLDKTPTDVIACETIPDLLEARVLSQLLQSLTTPAWISFCCRDASLLHDGSRIEAAVEMFSDHKQVFAIGVNCCGPQYLETLIRKIRQVAPHKLIVVYPNSGQQYDAASKSWYGGETPQQWSAQAGCWYRAGASLIGGCCRIGPQHIRELALRKSWLY